jgi:hypothetical protein
MRDDQPARRAARLRDWLSGVPIQLVLGLQILAYLAFDVAAAPSNDVLSEGWWSEWKFISIGAFLAQPALLAIWAVLGPQRGVVQWPRALVLLLLVWWADTLGRYSWRPWGRFDAYDTLLSEVVLILGVCLSLWLVLQVPMVICRSVWSWRVSRPVRASRFTPRQFGLRHIFAWTAFLALFLGVSRYLLRDRDWVWPDGSTWEIVRDELFYIGFVSRALFPLLLPAIPLAGLALGDRRRAVFALAAFAFAAFGAVVSVALIADQNASVRLRDGVYEELGFCGAVLASLGVVRICGFRLAPLSDGRAAA